jgi:tRNA pseudouridine55 synthase
MRPSSGFLLVDKPIGVTSFDVVAALRHVLGTRKVGHSGTLDPQATGLLLIGFGPATRLLSAFHSDKTYEATIRLGMSTDTDDAAGTFVAGQTNAARQKVRLLAGQPRLVSRAIAEHLTGDIDQVPSAYSAVRVGGKHAYDLARKGVDVRIAPRRIHVAAFDVVPGSVRLMDGVQARTSLVASANPANADLCADDDVFCDMTASITCSEGTYVRSLARDLGRILGVGGYVTALRRVRVGSLGLSSAVAATVQERRFTGRDGQEHVRLRPIFDAQDVLDHLLPAATLVWQSLPCVRISRTQAHLLETGLGIRLGADNESNAQALSVLENDRHASGAGQPASHRTGGQKDRNASLCLGPFDRCVVAVCSGTLVGVAEDHGSHGLHPRTILDQSFVARSAGMRDRVHDEHTQEHA